MERALRQRVDTTTSKKLERCDLRRLRRGGGAVGSSLRGTGQNGKCKDVRRRVPWCCEALEWWRRGVRCSYTAGTRVRMLEQGSTLGSFLRSSGGQSTKIDFVNYQMNLELSYLQVRRGLPPLLSLHHTTADRFTEHSTRNAKYRASDCRHADQTRATGREDGSSRRKDRASSGSSSVQYICALGRCLLRPSRRAVASPGKGWCRIQGPTRC